MKRRVGFHPRYAQMIPALHGLLADDRVIAVKLESMHLMGVERLGFDLLIRHGELLQPIVFAELHGDRILFPESYASVADALEAIVNRLEGWLDLHLADQLPMLYFLERDAALEAAASDEETAAVVPGLATYQRAIDACDRYRSIAALACGRTVLDMGESSGYGAHILASSGALAVSSMDDRTSAIRRALGSVDVQVVGTPDLIVALGLGAKDVKPTLERMRSLGGAQTFIAMSGRGVDAQRELVAAGLTAMPLHRPGANYLPPLDEYLTVAGPPLDIRIERNEPQPVTVAEAPLRVLFALRPSAETIFGGDVVQVRQTAEALRRRGHDVVVTTEPAFDASGFDIVHVSNVTVPRETLGQLDNVRTFPGPIVLMPIFTDHADETVWAMNLQNGLYTQPADVQELQGYLSAFAQRRLNVTIPYENRAVSAPERIGMEPGYEAAQKEICRRADFAIANAHGEMHCLYRHLDCSIPYAVAPSAIDAEVYSPGRAAAFQARYMLGDFVLLAGRIEPRKNQMMLMSALRDLGMRLLLIGRSYDALYGEIVRTHLGKDTILLGHMDERTLAGALAAARVVAMPSFDEVVSLTSLNAAACGASLVLTRQSYEHEYLRDDAEYCDPVDVESIRDAVKRAWNLHGQRAERRRTLSERVRREYTWDRSAELTEAAYYRVRASNPRGERRLGNLR
ncbi:MAG: hypothetical protein NVSMB64_00440 [Candidatus Velthaea sp.]